MATVLVQSIVVLIIYSIWLQRRAIATLRRLFSGGRTLPPLSVSDVLPLRIRSVFATLFMFSFVLIYIGVIQSLRSDLWAHIVAIETVDVVNAVHLLARFAVMCIGLTHLTGLYIIGLARYATEGERRKAANRILDEFGLLKHRRRSCQYVLLQLMMLGGAVYLLALGVLVADVTWPAIQSFAPEGGKDWQYFGMFAFFCGFVLVWNASLHLLAQYAQAIGIHFDDCGLQKAKAKRGLTLE